MEITRTCYIQRLMYNFRNWLLSNKKVLIKLFLTGALTSEACKTTLKFLEKIPVYVIVICRTG